MSKRDGVYGQDDRPPKRPRPTRHVHVDRPVEEIFSARQLQQLLSFQQDDIQQLRHGISSCKAFLDAIVYNPHDESQQRQLSLLKDYLDSERPKNDNDTERPYFTQLWQAWSFANSNNSDHLSSAICSHFALLLKTLSSLVDFREYGRLLCRTVLQHQHLRLIKRCLDAPRHKEFLLSPSLRLLTEITQFDGGVLAHEVYKHREQTFDQAALRKCLAIVKADTPEEDLRRRPAVRTVAVRYILSHLRLQDEGGKIDILKQRHLCSTLFSYFRSDPPEVILEILRTCETYVFKDADLPRASKAALLTQQHLDRVLDIATRAELNDDVSNGAIAWLKAVCSTPSYGILRSSGWYPPGSTYVDGRKTFDHGAIDLGLESLNFWENAEKYQLKNVVLSSWIHTLKPASDLRERELILTCFKSAPELVHAYFKDNAFQMDPKLTNTWIGYASFLYGVVNLPMPVNAGNVDSTTYATLPPQTSIVMNNLLPKPLTQKVMTRCLNQSDKLISFFIVRILILALDKVQQLRQEYTLAAQRSAQPELWKEATTLLNQTLAKTLPSRKDVVTLFRRIPNDDQHKMQREITTRLARLYLSNVPAIGSDESIDVSAVLAAALSDYDSKDDRAIPSWDILEIENLIAIARHGADVRWYQKHGNPKAAPITTMLQICAKENDTNTNLKTLVQEILVEDSMLPAAASNADDRLSAFEVLIWSLQKCNEHVLEFLEQCLARLHKAPVKYLDELDSFDQDEMQSDAAAEGAGQQVLLAAVLLEQAPFVISKPADEQKAIMKWVNTLFQGWSQSSASSVVLDQVKTKIDSITGWKAKDRLKLDPPQSSKPERQTQGQHQDEDRASKMTSELSIFTAPSAEKTDHPELFRWQKKDLDLAIEEHDIDGLILCLCSEHTEIRRQARSMLETLMSKLQESDIEHKEQLYILIGELTETYDLSFRAENIALPYIAGTFAVQALHIQMDPTHQMYSKINKYLLKSPDWRVNGMTSYLLKMCSSQMPSEDDSYWKEVQWVLEWLVDGLRTQADLEILRKSGSFERLMTIHSSPAAPDKLVRQRVMEILYRAALIEPITLITRAGVLSWLSMQRGDLAAALKQVILEQTDSERLESWTGRTHMISK